MKNYKQEKHLQLGTNFDVGCETEYYSPSDARATCFVAPRGKDDIVAVFDYEVYKGEVLKANAKFHKKLIGTKMDGDKIVDGMVQPADATSAEIIQRIHTDMKSFGRNWQTISAIPIKEFEDEFKRKDKEIATKLAKGLGYEGYEDISPTEQEKGKKILRRR